MMPKTYSKREFLRIMGLGLAFIPFIGCFDHSGDDKKAGEDHPGEKDNEQDRTAEAPEVTDADILLLARNDSRYAAFNAGFNKRIQHLPKYIAVCKTEAGVLHAIRKARTEGLPVAVKSGGHSFEGFSGNDGGLVINLSQMKAINWLSEEEVEIQPGCLLQEVQDGLFPRKKLLPAGSCGTVGIAGLTLGGGYGFFSRKYGLTCDSLLGLRLAGADGLMHTTEDDPELLWACRGGGNGNFGVVTSLRFRLHDMPATFDSYVLKFRNMDAARFSATLEAWFTVSDTLPEEAFAAYVLNGTTLTVLITTYRAQPGFVQLLTPLSTLADTVKPTLQADLPQAMKRYYGRKGPIYFKNASAGLYRDKEDILKVSERLFALVADNRGIVFQVNTLGGKIADPDREQASCYPHRDLSYLGELQAYWDREGQEEPLLAAFEAIQALFQDSGIRAHYRNYPDIQFKDWETAYYGQHYARLQQVKRRYDSENLFRYPQSIRP